MQGRNLTAILENSLNDKPCTTSLHQIFTRGISYINLKHQQLSNADANPSFHGKLIDKVQLICHKQNNPFERVKCYAAIRYSNQQTEIFIVKPHKILQLLNLFKSLGSTIEEIFRRTGVQKMNWQRVTQKEIYHRFSANQPDNDSPAKYYSNLHEDMIEFVMIFLKQQHELPINIIDGGCGDGSLLKNIAERIDTNFRGPSRPACVGFDFNKRNLTDCKENYFGPCHFVYGNLLEVDQVMQTLQASELIHTDPSAVSILLLSGSLTRLVLSDLYDGIKALRSIARCDNIKALLGGGVGEPMINSYLAKQHGFKRTIAEPDSQFFFYNRMSREEFVSYKIEKMRRKNILDLSFCPHDNVIDALLPHVTDNMVIDLSYCHYTAHLEEVVWNIVLANPSVRLIFQHDNPDYLRAFHDRFIGKAWVMTITFSELKNEFDLYGYMRRAPRQYATYFQPSNADRKCMLLSSTVNARALTLTQYLFAYQGARHFADVNIYETFIAHYFAKCNSPRDYFAARTAGIDQLLQVVKQRLLLQYADKLLKHLGTDYIKHIESLNFKTSVSIQFRGISLNLGEFRHESIPYLIELIRQLILDEMANLKHLALHEHNPEALMTLVSIRIKDIIIHHTEWQRCFTTHINDDPVAHLTEELSLYRYISEHYQCPDDADFMQELSFHTTFNYHHYSLETPPAIRDANPELLAVFAKIWNSDFTSPEKRQKNLTVSH